MAYAAAVRAQTQPKKPTTAAAKTAPAGAKPAAKPVAKTVAPHPVAGKPPLAAGAVRKPTTSTAAAGKGTAAKTGAANASHARPVASKSASARHGKKGRPTPRRTRQMAPAPERYQEIQQALVSKGYLKPEQASGVWDQNSSDALKRFQGEQKLPGTGKIDSLSLIALGLGPKHDVTEARPAPLAAPDQSTVQNP